MIGRSSRKFSAVALLTLFFVSLAHGRLACGQATTSTEKELFGTAQPNSFEPPLFADQANESASPLRYQAGPPSLPNNWLQVGGRIPISKIESYPRIPALDQSGGFFDTWRPNILGIEVPEEWDFQNMINTDRPDFTDATYSVGEGVVYLETGYTFERTNADGVHLRRQQLPESLLRVGVTNDFELRMKWNGLISTDMLDTNTRVATNSFGGDDLQLSVKWELIQQDGWRPMVTFVGGTIVPTGTRGISANQLQPSSQLVYGWGFRRWLYLKGSTGVDFVKSAETTAVVEGTFPEPVVIDSEDNISEWHQSISLLFQISPRVGGFVEWFSLFNDNGSDRRAAHFMDAGLAFYVTPDVQLDMRIGQRISNRADTLFTGAGFSTRW